MRGGTPSAGLTWMVCVFALAAVGSVLSCFVASVRSCSVAEGEKGCCTAYGMFLCHGQTRILHMHTGVLCIALAACVRILSSGAVGAATWYCMFVCAEMAGLVCSRY